jgi:hypothetical protein
MKTILAFSLTAALFASSDLFANTPAKSAVLPAKNTHVTTPPGTTGHCNDGSSFTGDKSVACRGHKQSKKVAAAVISGGHCRDGTSYLERTKGVCKNHGGIQD